MTDNDRAADIAEIHAVVSALYEAISFEGEDGPDFDRLDALFAPGAHVIEVKEEGTEFISFPRFIDRAIDQLERGRITRFHEAEVWHSLDYFGHIAHVLSTYEARDHAGDAKLLARGINSIQLLKDPDGWRVVSIMWQNEDAEDRIPPIYLPDGDRDGN